MKWSHCYWGYIWRNKQEEEINNKVKIYDIIYTGDKSLDHQDIAHVEFHS